MPNPRAKKHDFSKMESLYSVLYLITLNQLPKRELRVKGKRKIRKNKSPEEQSEQEKVKPQPSIKRADVLRSVRRGTVGRHTPTLALAAPKGAPVMFRGSICPQARLGVHWKLRTSPNHYHGNKNPTPELPQKWVFRLPAVAGTNLTSAKSLSAFIGWNLNALDSLLIVARPCYGANVSRITQPKNFVNYFLTCQQN